MNRIKATWRNGCFDKMDDNPVHTIQTTTLPKWMFSQNTFVQIILAAKWSVRHSTTTMAPTFAFSFVFILLLCFHFARQGIFTVCLIFYECVGVAMQHCSRLLASSQARGLLINMLATLVGPSKLKRKSNLHCSETKIKNIEFISTCFASRLAKTMLLIQSKWFM